MNKKTDKRYFNETPLDNYEKELQGFLDKGVYQRGENFGEVKKMLEEAAKAFADLRQSRSITLRVNKQDLIRVKAKAKRSNIPYQTLINLLISHYVEGKSQLTL